MMRDGRGGAGHGSGKRGGGNERRRHAGGPCAFGWLGRLVAVQCPRELAPLMAAGRRPMGNRQPPMADRAAPDRPADPRAPPRHRSAVESRRWKRGNRRHPSGRHQIIRKLSLHVDLWLSSVADAAHHPQHCSGSVASFCLSHDNPCCAPPAPHNPCRAARPTKQDRQKAYSAATS